MLQYTLKTLSESELEYQIRENPHLLEANLRYLASQRKTGRGPLDLLLIDSGNALVVAELKVVRNDEMLVQALDYYDYVFQNLDRLAKAYEVKEFKINTEEKPRLMLIAPEFSQPLINRCKWLDIKIELYRYRYLQSHKQEEELGTIIDFIPVEIPKIPITELVYTEKKVLNYITSLEIRKIALEFLAKIKIWDGVRVDPVKYALSIKIKKDVFVYLIPIRKGFHIDGYASGHNWQRFTTVRSQNDLNDAINAAQRAYYNIKDG